MATRWLDNNEMRGWRAFVQNHGHLMAALEADLAAHGLSHGDYEVLVLLSETPQHQSRMSDLSERLGLSPSGLTRRLDGLERLGYVKRTPNVADRRVMNATITGSGFEALQRAVPDHVASVRRHLVDRLTPEQLTTLGDIFLTIADGLGRPGWPPDTDRSSEARPEPTVGSSRSAPSNGGWKLPGGFSAYVANIGIKDSTVDFVVVAAEQTCSAAAVFTLSRFAGPSVVVSREHVADHAARAVVVISKNANVATGAEGLANAREVIDGVAAAIGCAASDVLIASTGVIGRQYPMERVRAGLVALADQSAPFAGTNALDIATGIMTTDTVAKVASATIAGPTFAGAAAATVVGVAKGVGMIEPDMATLITLMFTDADIGAAELDSVFRRVIDRTFNCVSVDTDTSTSDTAIVLASGAAGPVDIAAFEAALEEVALSLTKQVARDGEGATKLIEVRVDGARDRAQARRVARAIVNSPLVKTAVHGADPNWGRVAMAIGKCSGDTDIDESAVVIRFGSQECYPVRVDEQGLDELSAYLRGDEVLIHVSLGVADGAATEWGCDLSAGYVRINADYTT